MHEEPFVGRFRVVEGALVPDAAFVEEERVALGIPVAGNIEMAGGVEIVFDQFGLGLRLAVFVERIVALEGLSAIIDGANVVGIDDSLPLAVEAGSRACIDVGDERSDLRGSAPGCDGD